MVNDRFLRSADGKTWNRISQNEMQDILRLNYKDVNMAIQAMRDGQEVRTTFAFYKIEKPSQPAQSAKS